MDKILTVDNLKNAGITGMLIFILWASFSGQWVWGTQLKVEQDRTTVALAERDKWMKLALEGTKLAEVASNKNVATAGIPVPPGDVFVQPKTLDDVRAKLDQLHNKIEPGIER